MAGEQKFGLHFGAICDPIVKQLKKQGLELPYESGKCFQKDADAITRLCIRLDLPDGVAQKLRNKLLNQIGKKLTVIKKQIPTRK